MHGQNNNKVIIILSMKNINLPNIITFCRIVLLPVMLFSVFKNNEFLFKWLLLVALISDILDGLIARLLKIQTDFGARLDSIADLGMYISAVTGILKFQFVFVKENFVMILIVLSFFILARILTFIRYKKFFNNFHSYLSKAMAYFQGIFIMILFFFGFKPYLFYPACFIGIIANMEEYLLLYFLPVEGSNVKGLYWVLKQKK